MPDKFDEIKIKAFFSPKDIIERERKQTVEWEKKKQWCIYLEKIWTQN